MNYTVSLRKRSDTWSYQILLNGKYHSSKSGFKTKAEAKRAGDKVGQRIRQQPEESKLSFKAIADLYIKDGPKEPSTIQTYEYWLKNFEAIHPIEITKLTYGDVSPIIHDYAFTHKYNGTMSLLGFGKAICKYAIEKLDIDMKNPFTKVTILKKSSNAKKEHRILTMLEMKKLFALIDDPDFKLLAMFFGLAGLRLSEARGLTFAAVGKNEITVKQQRQVLEKTVSIKENTKSFHSHRKITLHPDLKKELAKRPKNINKDALILEHVYHSHQIGGLFDHLGYVGMTAHSLRHSFATACLQNGMDYKTLAQIMGDTVEMITNTYSHVNVEMEERASNILTNL